MVLSAPAAHDEPGPCRSGWIEQITLGLRLAQAGILLHVDRGRPERLGQLVRALLVAHPELDVLLDVKAVRTLPPGSVFVLVPRPEDADFLNGVRPVFAQRRYKVVLFCDRPTTLALIDSAPDFLDWVSQHHECPEGPAPHAVLGLRSAVAAGAPGIHWRGARDDVAGMWSALSAAFPGEPLRWILPEREYEWMVREIQEAGDGWVACKVRAERHLHRFRWAFSEAGKTTRAIAVSAELAAPGFWPVHDHMLPLQDATRLLEGAGATRPSCLAALVGLEPEAVELARRFVERGKKHDELVALLVGAADPGALLARKAREEGLLGADLLGSPVDSRGSPDTFQIQARKLVEQAQGSSREALTIEQHVRGEVDPREWARLAERAARLGELDVAVSWALRSIEGSGKIFKPVRRIPWETERGRVAGAKILERAFEDEKEALARAPLTALTGLIWLAGFVSILFGIGQLAMILHSGPLAGAALLANLFWLFHGGPALHEWQAKKRIHIQIDRAANTTTPRDGLEPEGAAHEVPPELQGVETLHSEGRSAEAMEALRRWQHSAGAPLNRQHPHFRYSFLLSIRFRHDGDTGVTLDPLDLEQAIVLEERLGGVGGALLADLMIELAITLACSGDSAGALALLGKLLASGRFEQIFEPLPPTLPASLQALRPELRDVVGLFLAQPATVSALRPESRARALRVLAEVLLSQGRYEEAEDVAKSAQVLGSDGKPLAPLEALRALGIQGSAAALAGRYQEGKTSLQKAIDLAEDTVGKRHLETARLRRTAARAAARHGDPGAVDMARRALGIYAGLIGAKEEREEALQELGRIAEPS